MEGDAERTGSPGVRASVPLCVAWRTVPVYAAGQCRARERRQSAHVVTDRPGRATPSTPTARLPQAG